MWKFIHSIKRWSEDVFRKSKYKYPLEDLGSESDFGRLIQTSLLKIFIENEINIHTLEIEIKTHSMILHDYADIIKLILQNINFIRNIKNLKLSILSFYDNTQINKYILQIINSHQNLKKIVLSNSNDFLFYQPLLLSKDYNHCSNTLNSITLYRVNFKDASSKVDESLLLLLRKFGGYLENFRSVNFLSKVEQQKILESVIEYCKNIKLLGIYNMNDEIVYPVLNLIENMKQNLNCLSICCERSKLDNSSSILLQNLGQILPSKLEYLNLFLYINANDFEVFLKNSQGTFIKILLIRDLMQKYNNNILPYIKEYIMKEKRVRYLNFKNNGKELFDFSDEVNEFKLHNIEVQKYNDLVIDNRQLIQIFD
ncbi:hypothetical protein GLOIN_2v940391 [Rhizophagus irregularis DAOM 181602=DAOM 197198]|nr:hypothetical protein GLOIN_2v940391 [Rhizophagus irregularis DAOM 181602=DAOM 197198]